MLSLITGLTLSYLKFMVLLTLFIPEVAADAEYVTVPCPSGKATSHGLVEHVNGVELTDPDIVTEKFCGSEAVSTALAPPTHHPFPPGVLHVIDAVTVGGE
jgi:hypothetical protein